MAYDQVQGRCVCVFVVEFFLDNYSNIAVDLQYLTTQTKQVVLGGVRSCYS